jgi:hypothetical protein
VDNTRQASWILNFFLGKASPSAYSINRLNNESCLTLIACDVLCITCRVLLDDGNRLHGSTLPYTILDIVVLLLQLDVLCLVDRHWWKSSGRFHSHVGHLFMN